MNRENGDSHCIHLDIDTGECKHCGLKHCNVFPYKNCRQYKRDSSYHEHLGKGIELRRLVNVD